MGDMKNLIIQLSMRLYSALSKKKNVIVFCFALIYKCYIKDVHAMSPHLQIPNSLPIHAIFNLNNME